MNSKIVETNLLKALKILIENWDDILSMEEPPEKGTVRTILFPGLAVWNFKISFYPEKVTFFLFHKWRVGDHKLFKTPFTVVTSQVKNPEFELLYQTISNKPTVNYHKRPGEDRQLRTFGRTLHNLIPLGNEAIHKIDFAQNKS